MTPPTPLASPAMVRRRRRARDAAETAFRAALVDAVDNGWAYRALAEAAGLSAARVHEIVALERADRVRRGQQP